MRIAYIAAGAAGMYCGTCIHDNTLAAALQRGGQEVALVPTYTPIRTDEYDVSGQRVFYGGINVFLQQKASLFRYTPWVLDRLFDAPGLLRWISRFSSSTNAEDLGALTVSVLEGEEGRQRKELAKLIQWLKDDFRPDLVHLTNAMFVGLARKIRDSLQVPVVCGLQGEDVFLEQLMDPYRGQAFDLLAQKAGDADAFIAPCNYYRDYAAEFLKVDPASIHVVRPGLNLQGHGAADPPDRSDGKPFTIGYLARIAPEKGLSELAKAYRIAADRVGGKNLRLRVAGYLGKKEESYLDDVATRLDAWGLAETYSYVGEVDRDEKVRFLNSLDVLSVPTPYRDPKGRYILEALANGIPVVQPRHGAFPELIDATNGGILVEPGSAEALADGLLQLKNDHELRRRLGNNGKAAVHKNFSDDRMAEDTLSVYNSLM